MKPKRLKRGDTIGLIAPAGIISEEKLSRAVETMNGLGFRVKIGEYVLQKNGYLAGNDAQRLLDLHAMFADKEVKAIVCIRGGYGTLRLLPNIDFSLIRKNPKIFIGYSDITALLHAIYAKTKLVCFHGPMALSDFSQDLTLDSFLDSLQEKKRRINYQAVPDEAHDVDTCVIYPGKAKGQLVGGNLSLLLSLIGTPYEINLKNKILFIEEVGEEPYRIDRMITQLIVSGRLSRVAGVVLGKFSNCAPENPERSLSLDELFAERFSILKIPVLQGFPFGHVPQNITLPIGVNAKMNSADLSLSLGVGVR